MLHPKVCHMPTMMMQRKTCSPARKQLLCPGPSPLQAPSFQNRNRLQPESSRSAGTHTCCLYTLPPETLPAGQDRPIPTARPIVHAPAGPPKQWMACQSAGQVGRLLRLQAKRASAVVQVLTLLLRYQVSSSPPWLQSQLAAPLTSLPPLLLQQDSILRCSNP